MFHVALCTDNSRSLHQLSVNIQRLPHPTDALEIHPFLQEYDLLRSCRQGICYNLILLGPFQEAHHVLDTARRIRKLDPGVSISLISHDLRDSLEGYEIPLFRFYAGTVPMPVLQQDLEELMQKKQEVQNASFLFSNWQGVHRFFLKEILYFKSEGSRIQVVTRLGSYIYRETMSTVERRLGRSCFVRIHRSYLVNLHWVRNVWGTEVTLLNGKIMPLSKHRSREIRDALLQLGEI